MQKPLGRMNDIAADLKLANRSNFYSLAKVTHGMTGEDLGTRVIPPLWSLRRLARGFLSLAFRFRQNQYPKVKP